MYVCMYVCMYVYIYIYIDTYTHYTDIQAACELSASKADLGEVAADD